MASAIRRAWPVPPERSPLGVQQITMSAGVCPSSPRISLSLEYQARHAVLDHCDCEEEILLPDVLLRALKAYIASKVFMHMNTQENTAKGQEHYLVYESICAEVVEKDLVSSSSSTTNVRFQKRGWI